MGWLIAGLLVLLLIGGLIAFGRVRERDRQPADDTLLAELLGEDVTPPPAAEPTLDYTAVQRPARTPDETAVLPPARTPEGTEILPAVPPSQPAGVPSTPPAPAPAPAHTQSAAPPEPVETTDQLTRDSPAEDGDWLESQLAWIRNWSQRMQDQIGPGGAHEPDRRDC